MRTETITHKIYTFEELGEEVQKKVIEKFRNTEGWCWDSTRSQQLSDYYAEKLQEKGYPSDDIEWRLSHCQGDGMAFYGDIDLEEWIEKNADNLEGHYKRAKHLVNELDFTMNIQRNSYGCHYAHYNTMTVFMDCSDYGDYRDRELLEATEEFLYNYVCNDIKEVSKELEGLGYDDIDHSYTDEFIKDEIKARELEFLENGTEWI